MITRQLATLIDSGLPLLRGLTVLGRQEPNLIMKGTINTLADNVQTGSTFSESLQQYPRIFNKLYINMVKAGEAGGCVLCNTCNSFPCKLRKKSDAEVCRIRGTVLDQPVLKPVNICPGASRDLDAPHGSALLSKV